MSFFVIFLLTISKNPAILYLIFNFQIIFFKDLYNSLKNPKRGNIIEIYRKTR